MKRIFGLLMMVVWILVFVFMATSCKTIKNWKKERVVVKEHHHYDTTHVIENLSIREVTAKPDSTNAWFGLRELIENGAMTSTDRYFTTKIIYQDSGLSVTTTIDSLITLVKELQRQTVTNTVQLQVEKDNELKSNTKSKESFILPSWGWWLIAVLLIVVVVLYFYLRMIRLK